MPLHVLRSPDDGPPDGAGGYAAALGRAIGHLDAAEPSVPALVRLVPELICALGFDRSMISRVEDDEWIPELQHVAGDPAWSQEVTELERLCPQSLIPGRVETEVVRTRAGVLARNVHIEHWRAYPAPAPMTRCRSYVAAPLLSDGRVVGMLHGARFGVVGEVDETDLAVLVAFAKAAQLAFSRAALATELQSVYKRLTQATRSVDRAVGDVRRLPELRLAGEPGSAASGAGSDVGAGNVAVVAAGLTPRELEVLTLVAAGKTNAAIARQLGVADSTIKQHVKNILRKLEIGTRAEAVARWFSVGNTMEI